MKTLRMDPELMFTTKLVSAADVGAKVGAAEGKRVGLLVGLNVGFAVGEEGWHGGQRADSCAMAGRLTSYGGN